MGVECRNEKIKCEYESASTYYRIARPFKMNFGLSEQINQHRKKLNKNKFIGKFTWIALNVHILLLFSLIHDRNKHSD